MQFIQVTSGNNLVQDVQNQAVASGFIEVFEIELPDSNIGGHGIDRLYFHNGAAALKTSVGTVL